MTTPHETQVEYHFIRERVEGEDLNAKHALILSRLADAQKIRAVSGFELFERQQALPGNDRDMALLDELRNFAVRRKIKPLLASRKNPYGWFPSQLLLVRERGQLTGAFPCELDGGRVYADEFLEALLTGKAWTLLNRKKDQGKSKHATLTKVILDDPSRLEAGLTLLDSESFVSGDSLEAGRIDLVFRDGAGRYLLVEVKVNANEIKTGIGQLLIQRELFVELNRIAYDEVRLGLACPDIPAAARKACGRAGIVCFDLAAGSRAGLAR